MKQRHVKEIIEKNLDNYQQMKTIARAYATKRECSVQEAVCHAMPELWLRKAFPVVIYANSNIPELWLRKAFPGVIYANSNIPERRVKMMLTGKEIIELPDDSKVYKRNMLDRY